MTDLTGGVVDSVDKLTSVLEDQNFSYSLDARKAIYCYCKDVTDIHGSKFSDNYPSDLVTMFDDSLNCDEGYDNWNS